MGKKRINPDDSDFERMYSSYIKGDYDQQFEQMVESSPFKDKNYEDDTLDLTNEDYLDGDENPYTYQGGLDLEAKDPFNEIRAVNQGGWSEAGTGVGRTASKISREVLKTAGAIGGATAGLVGNTQDLLTGKDDTDFLSATFNNDFIKGVDKSFDDFNKANLPVYVKDAVTNGDFWDKVSSGEFYATEGADGLGYMISAMGPGFAAKALGLGNKIFRAGVGLNRLRFAGNVNKARKAMGAMSAGKIDGVIIPAFNTFFEAGAEGKGVEDTLNLPENVQKYYEENQGSQQHQQLTIQKLKDLDVQRKSGEIDANQYNELSASASQNALEEMRKQDVSSSVQRAVLKNAFILAGPNYIQAKIMYGKNAAKNLAKKVTEAPVEGGKKTIGEAIGGAVKAIPETGAGRGIKRVGEGFLVEGGEEVSQSAIEHRSVEDALSGKVGESVIDDFALNTFTNDFVKTLSTTEGQVAGFLGGILAAPISVYQGAKQDVKDKTKEAQLISKIRAAGSSINDIHLPLYQTRVAKDPKTGEEFDEIIMDENGPVQNKENIIKAGKAIKHNEELSRIYDKAVLEGDTKTVEDVVKKAEHDLIMNFINEDEVSLDALAQHLDATMPSDTEDASTNKTNQSRRNSIIDKAKFLQKELTSFKDMSTNIIKIDKKDASDKQVEDFLETLGKEFLSDTSRAYDLTQMLDKLNDAKANLDKQSIVEVLNPNYVEGVSHELDKTVTKRQNPRLDLVQKQINAINKELLKIDENLNVNTWNSELVNKAFIKQTNQEAKNEKALSPEKVAENNKKSVDVKTAKTRDELDKIDTSEDPALAAEKARKEAEIVAKQKAARDAKIAQEEEEEEEGNAVDKDMADFISEVSQETETTEEATVTEEVITEPEVIPVTEEPQHAPQGKQILHPITEEPITILADDKNAIKIVDENGEVKQLPKNKKEPGDGSAKDVPINDSNPVLDGATNTDAKTPGVATNNTQYSDYLMDPRSKIGDPVTFSLNMGSINTNKEGLATGTDPASNAYNVYQRLLKSGFKGITPDERETLISGLAINFNYNNKASSWSAYPKNKIGGNYLLRKSIIDALIEGNSLESLSTIVKNQETASFNSELDGKVPAKNNVLELYDFTEVKNITDEVPLYHINDSGEPIRVSRASAKFEFKDSKVKPDLSGEIFVVLKHPKGNNVPAKLNTNKLNSNQAYGLASIYAELLKDPELRTTPISAIDSLQDALTDWLSNEVKVLGNNPDLINFGQLIELLVVEESKHGREIIVNNDTDFATNIQFMNVQYPLDTAESIKDLANALVANKKQNVITLTTKEKVTSIPKINFQNSTYLNYLFQNKIVSTDIKTGGERSFVQATDFKTKTTGSELWLQSSVNKPAAKTLKEKLAAIDTTGYAEAIASTEKPKLEIEEESIASLSDEQIQNLIDAINSDSRIKRPVILNREALEEIENSTSGRQTAEILEKYNPERAFANSSYGVHTMTDIIDDAIYDAFHPDLIKEQLAKYEREAELDKLIGITTSIDVARLEPTQFQISKIAEALDISLPEEDNKGVKLLRQLSLSGGVEYKNIQEWLDSAESIVNNRIAAEKNKLGFTRKSPEKSVSLLEDVKIENDMEIPATEDNIDYKEELKKVTIESNLKSTADDYLGRLEQIDSILINDFIIPKDMLEGFQKDKVTLQNEIDKFLKDNKLIKKCP